MYYALFILVGAINVGVLLFAGPQSLYTCSLLSLMNVCAFPMLSYFLTSLSFISSPILKGLGYHNHTEKSEQQYVVYETLKLMKQPFFAVLILAPFLMGLLLNNDLFANFDFQRTLVMISILLSAVYLLGLSSLMRNFCSHHSWVATQVPLILFVGYMLFLPHKYVYLFALALTVIVVTLALSVYHLYKQEMETKSTIARHTHS